MVKGHQSVMMKQRLEYIDLAEGFAMLMVVYIHISINYADNPFADFWVRRMMYILNTIMVKESLSSISLFICFVWDLFIG